MNDPFLSIIVPVYNVEKFLHQCVDSILAQTFSDFELILVDDGATDSSGVICDKYTKIDKRVKVIHKKNGGHTSARKAGLAISRGEYIGFVDSDDWIEPEMYEKLMKVMNDHQLDMAICDFTLNFSNNEKKKYQNITPGFFDKQKLIKFVYPTMLYNGIPGGKDIHLSMYNKVFHRNVLLKNLETVDTRITMGEDTACVIPALLDSERIFVLDSEYLYHYRQNLLQLSRNYKHNYFRNILLLFESLRKVNNGKNVFNIYPQLEKRLCFSAIKALENEFSIDSPKSLLQKLDFVKQVCNHPYIIQAYRGLKIEKNKKILFKYYLYSILLKNQWSFLLFVLLLIAWGRKKLKFIFDPMTKKTYELFD